MANLKEIRIRIASVESTKQITSAMKLVAASKLRKAQDAITQMRPYAAKMHEMMQGLAAGGDVAKENVYAQERDIQKVLIVAVTSNRGLCGAFNTNVIKTVNLMLKEDYKLQNSASNVDIITIGRKASEFFSKPGYNLVGSHDAFWDHISWENAQDIVNPILEKFADQTYDRVDIVYNQFKNAATQVIQQEQFLPVVPIESESTLSVDYIMEPSQEVIVNELIPKSLKVQMYKALLDSYASEHGARMTSMHKATDNATEMVKSLKLTYNKARQAAITNEIIEIVSGANAL